MAEYVTLQPDKLAEAMALLCHGTGSNEREASLVARNLVLANLSGHDSHGIGMMPTYLSAASEGRLKVNQHARVERDEGALITIDGGLGYGQVIGHEAMEIGIRRAKRLGTCIVAVHHSHHVGRIGHWAEQCAGAGLVSMHYVNVVGRPPLVAPFGGTDGRFSTNPFCAALPRPGEPPVVLDMATSRIALGKVRVAKNKGETLPPGILIDAAGNPSIDPNVMYAEKPGAVLPFGEHKGSGLAVIAELFAGALTGGFTMKPGSWDSMTVINNMLSVLIDPARLGGAGNFGGEIDAFVQWVKASPPVGGSETVMLPGEPERQRRHERARAIPVDIGTWREILAAGKSVGISISEIERHAGL